MNEQQLFSVFTIQAFEFLLWNFDVFHFVFFLDFWFSLTHNKYCIFEICGNHVSNEIIFCLQISYHFNNFPFFVFSSIQNKFIIFNRCMGIVDWLEMHINQSDAHPISYRNKCIWPYDCHIRTQISNVYRLSNSTYVWMNEAFYFQCEKKKQNHFLLLKFCSKKNSWKWIWTCFNVSSLNSNWET